MIHGFQPMAPLLPESTKGRASIKHFVPDGLSLLRAGINGFHLKEGHQYCQLWINGELWMSDTRDEMRANADVTRARGTVLIVGLGLGMVLRRVLQNLTVSAVDVIENNRDVERLVWPRVGKTDTRARLIHADAHDWQAERKYDFIWLDIWLNTPEPSAVTDLRKRYRRFLRRGGFIGAWEGN